MKVAFPVKENKDIENRVRDHSGSTRFFPLINTAGGFADNEQRRFRPAGENLTVFNRYGSGNGRRKRGE